MLRRQTGLGAEAARAREVLRRVAALLAGHPHAGRDQPISFAYAGLITSSMIHRRSSNGMNALFIALIVNHCMSFQP